MNPARAKDAHVEGRVVIWTALGPRTQQTMRETFATESDAQKRWSLVGEDVRLSPTPVSVERGAVEVKS